jgi:hypothetical protein
LTKDDQLPKLGRSALLALARWVKQHRNRSVGIEAHGVEENPPRMSHPFDQFIGENSNKKAKKEFDQGEPS